MKREYNKLLADYTSLKIGGPAYCWLEPESLDDVLDVIQEAEAKALPLSIIGKGSNILVKDKGFEGIVINLDRGFDYIERVGDELLKVGAGTSISRVIRETLELGLGGCEFLAGIPGSFGGAVFMNAGVQDREVKDIIFDVDVIDLEDRKIKTLKRDEIDFQYRSSGLEKKFILGARIRLHKDKKEDIINRIDSYMKNREWIQNLSLPTAGSVFKNPDTNLAAGKLIELCGLRGKRIGGAGISEEHANFIVNMQDATSKDVLDLIELVKCRVKEKFGVELELELKII